MDERLLQDGEQTDVENCLDFLKQRVKAYRLLARHLKRVPRITEVDALIQLHEILGNVEMRSTLKALGEDFPKGPCRFILEAGMDSDNDPDGVSIHFTKSNAYRAAAVLYGFRGYGEGAAPGVAEGEESIH